MDGDTCRSVRYNSETSNSRPQQDRVGYAVGVFGSCHSGTWGMVMCDGSVQRISYSIDPLTHAYLGSRNDGKIATLE